MDTEVSKSLKIFRSHKDAFRNIFNTSLKEFIDPVKGFEKEVFYTFLEERYGKFNNMYELVHTAYGFEGLDLIISLMKNTYNLKIEDEPEK